MVTTTRVGAVLLTILINANLIFAYYSLNENCTPSLTHVDDIFNDPLPEGIIPLQYNIILRLGYDDVFNGTISIFIQVLETTSTISFHIKDLGIDYKSIRLVENATSDGTKYKHRKVHYCTKAEIFSLMYDTELPLGYYTLSMTYMAVVWENLGLVKIKRNKWNSESVTSYITIFEPNGARRVFPCWDEPMFKAIFNITVDHLPEYRVFSNMQQHTVTQLTGDYHMRTSFEPTSYMSTYLVTIGLLNSMYGNVTDDRVWFSKQVTREESNRLRRIVRWTDNYLMRYTDTLWLNSTTHAVAFSKLPTEVVGGWHCAVFRDSDVAYNEKFDISSHSWNVWRIVTHGLTRQCIETMVNPVQWSDLWLSRALELYISHDMIKKRFNTEWMIKLYIVQTLQPALHNDIAFDVPPVMHKYDPIYSSFIYKKAFALINMLERIVTRTVLKQAIVDYLHTYAYNFASPSDFFNKLNSAKLRLTGKIPYNTATIMTAWLSHKKYPTLLVTRNYDTNSTTLSYDYTGHTPNERVDLMIPITFTTQKYSYVYDIPILWTNNSSSQFYDSVKFPKMNRDEWILLNENRVGYFRVNYDDENWQRIAHYLRHNDHWKIDPLARAQILDDAYHFVMEERMNLSTYLNLVAYLGKETDFVVWHSVMSTLEYMSPFFNFPESESFKNLMLLIMNKALEVMGRYNERDDHSFQKATRLLLLNWACKHGDYKCRETAKNIMQAQLIAPQNYPKCWVDWMFCAGLMNTTNKIWEILQYNFQQGNDIRNIQYLACNENEHMITELLRSITFGTGDKWSKLKSVQLRKLYNVIIKKHARKNKVLDFILENFDHIFPSYMTKTEKLGNVIMNLYSKCQIEKISRYVINNLSWNQEEADAIRRLLVRRLHQINKQRHTFVRRLSHDIKEEKC